MNRVLEYIALELPLLPKWLNKIIANTITIEAEWANSHLFRGHIPNFTYNCAWSPECDTKTLHLIDGGYATNLPLEIILDKQRQLDIIIVVDFGHVPHVEVLKEAEGRIRKAGLKFPPIDYSKVATGINVFQDDMDRDCPVIVHMPFRGDTEYSATFDPWTADYCSTYNFSYTHEQAAEVAGLGEFLMKKHHRAIVDVIRSVIKRKTPH